MNTKCKANDRRNRHCEMNQITMDERKAIRNEVKERKKKINEKEIKKKRKEKKRMFK